MIFRLSQKLSTRAKVRTGTVLPLDENPFADWSAHVFIADRTQYIIICNTKSLYSTVMYAKGVTDDNRFIKQALSSLREFMEDDGQAFIYHQFIAPTCGSVHFAKALDGSLNDLIYHATVWLTEGELSPHDVGFKLNNIPFSPLAYAKPREAFKSMLPQPVTESTRKA